MRALVYHGRSQLSVEDVEAPHAGPGEVRVKIHSVGLCRSDLYGYSGRNNCRDEVLGEGETLVMGHEPVGLVDELGPGVEGLELFLLPGSPAKGTASGRGGRAGRRRRRPRRLCRR